MTQTSNPVDFLHPTKSCDLVMKGGLTSGIVYPAAVLKLAEQYKFKCIGGTSAGAIAAAVTAAAEAGRDTGGFEKLQKVAAEIAEPGFPAENLSGQRTSAIADGSIGIRSGAAAERHRKKLAQGLVLPAWRSTHDCSVTYQVGF